MLLGEFVIPDDSGILALVDSKTYWPYIGPDWTLEEILTRFREAMSEMCLLAWSAGSEGNWRIVAVVGEADPGSDQFAEGSIRVGESGLHVVSYDDLTMAAQFPDVPVPQSHASENLIRLSPGLYTCRVSRLFDPDEDDREAVFFRDAPHFWLTFTPSLEPLDPWAEIRWLQL